MSNEIDEAPRHIETGWRVRFMDTIVSIQWIVAQILERTAACVLSTVTTRHLYMLAPPISPSPHRISRAKAIPHRIMTCNLIV